MEIFEAKDYPDTLISQSLDAFLQDILMNPNDLYSDHGDITFIDGRLSDEYNIASRVSHEVLCVILFHGWFADDFDELYELFGEDAPPNSIPDRKNSADTNAFMGAKEWVEKIGKKYGGKLYYHDNSEPAKTFLIKRKLEDYMPNEKVDRYGAYGFPTDNAPKRMSDNDPLFGPYSPEGVPVK